MSHTLPYPASNDASSTAMHPPVCVRDSLQEGGQLSSDFLASLRGLHPNVSPTSRTAQDIAAFLNGSSPSFHGSAHTYPTPAQTLLSQQAIIQALLASAKQSPLPPAPFGQSSFAPNMGPSPYGNSNGQPPLWTQESSGQQQQQPSSNAPFNLAQYQAYLAFHAQRFAPSFNTSNYIQQQLNNNNQQQQQQQQQPFAQSSSTPFYPALPFLAGGGESNSSPSQFTSSASSHSTAESPSLPELGQDFIYDPAFDLSGGANDFDSASPYLQPANLLSSGYDYHKEAALNRTFNLQQQQQQPVYNQHIQQPQQFSFDTESPLTTSPSSAHSTGSPYTFNALADPSYSNSGSEYEFHSAAAPRKAAGSPSSSTASVHSHNGEDTPEKKKHVCEICHRGFARAFNLKSHMHTHAPQRFKPFNCPAVGCTRSFSRSHDMERHRSGIHQEGPLAAKAGLIPEDSPAAAPGVKASAKKRTSNVRGVSSV